MSRALFKPKNESQQQDIEAVDRIFFKSLKKRDHLVNSTFELRKEKISALDLKIAMCIKQRAKMTKGGYNYILEDMWNWRPYYKISSSLLPKTITESNSL
ncbi:MAG: hypothetical protein ACJZ2B_05330 [Candidatus Neomarinimicrobiota bacterium]|nr:hypothetical protein [Candidatus Neomarinimicrobiota bacterium]|tara:strand:- start:327 stop:626 length:300 start_codon:yes stop_codon:yes gene_type:complete